MNLNNIVIPASLAAELYQFDLIDNDSIEADSPVPAGTTEKTITLISDLKDKTTWKYLGDNQKNILIVVNDKEAVYLHDNDLSFLTGVLSACKLSLAEVAIINIAGHPGVLYKELISFFKSRVIILFAMEPAGLGLPVSFPHFQIQPFGGVSFLSSPGFRELEHDKVLKSKLWVCLKRLFNI